MTKLNTILIASLLLAVLAIPGIAKSSLSIYSHSISAAQDIVVAEGRPLILSDNSVLNFHTITLEPNAKIILGENCRVTTKAFIFDLSASVIMNPNSMLEISSFEGNLDSFEGILKGPGEKTVTKIPPNRVQAASYQ